MPGGRTGLLGGPGPSVVWRLCTHRSASGRVRLSSSGLCTPKPLCPSADERGDAVSGVREVRAARQREDYVAEDRRRASPGEELRLRGLHEQEGCGEGAEELKW